jgi:uncharacterized protein (TIGR02246 family)
MNFSGPCDDRLAIRDLLDSFADAQTREDQELWASCWAEDAVWVTTQGEHRGKDKILAAWLAWNEAYHRARGILCRITLNQSASIVVEGNRAAGRSYFSVATFSQETDGPHLFYGMYRDEYVKVDGRWLFHKRIYESIASVRVGSDPISPKGGGSR